jgi:hypothetical protein
MLLARDTRSTVAQAPTDPVSAARNFLTDGVVDNSGYAACSYLTLKQQTAASERAGTKECRDAFDSAVLTLAGHRIQTLHQVDRLSARVTIRGDQAQVSLCRAGASIRFRLVKADFAEQEEFLPPISDWRIARGGLSVIPPVATARSRG